jgi:hypothetical protein
LHEVGCQKRHSLGDSFRFADSFLGAPGHHCAEGVWSGREQLVQVLDGFAGGFAGDGVGAQTLESDGQIGGIDVDEYSVDVVGVLVDQPSWVMNPFRDLVELGD